MDIWSDIAVGAMAMIGTLGGAFLAQRRSAALIAYRLEQLEKKVETHNRIIERTYRLEEQEAVLEERIKVANHRIDDLEKKGM